MAAGDVLFATLELDAPLTARDAATGTTLRTYDGTMATEEVIASGGVLFLLVNPSPQVYDDFRPEEVGSGAILWTEEHPRSGHFYGRSFAEGAGGWFTRTRTGPPRSGPGAGRSRIGARPGAP